MKDGNYSNGGARDNGPGGGDNGAVLLDLLKKPLVLALLILAGTLMMIYWLRGTLMPFLLGAVLAYIFMPLVDALARRRVSRALAAGAVVVGVFALGTGLILWVLPDVSREFRDASASLLEGIGRLDAHYPRLQAYFPGLPSPDDPAWREKLHAMVMEKIQPLSGQAGAVLAGLGGQLTGALTVLLELLFVPVFFFYLLVDGPRLLEAAERRIPAPAAATFSRLLDTIDSTLRAYVRSAAKVVVALVFVYALLFLSFQMPLAVPLALFCAAAHWVPYVGTAVSAGAAALLGLLHFGADWRVIAAPLAIFVIHLAEVTIITPRFVGKGVGLHPLITIVALLLGVRFLGMGGLILALPVAAVVAGLLPIVLPEHPLPPPAPPASAESAPEPSPDPASPS